LGFIAGGTALAAGFAIWVLARSSGASAEFEVEALNAGAERIDRNGHVMALSLGQRFAAEETSAIRTAQHGTARVRTPFEVRLHVGEASSIALVQTDSATAERIRLDRGTVYVRVPRLKSGSTFSVITADATVLVHGTEFEVSIVADGPPRTCVRVTEGRVSVDSASPALLGAGERWCSGSAAAANRPTEERVDAAPGAESASPARNGAPEVLRRPGAHGRATAAPPEAAAGAASARAGTLAEENKLFEQGLAALRAGDRAQARTHFQAFLVRYPRSPLAVQAERELRKLDEL
jgi:hypothetical protein